MKHFLGKLRTDPAWLTLCVAALIIMAVFLLWPLSTVFHYSFIDEAGNFSLTGYQRFFTEYEYRNSLGNTLILGFWVTFFSLVLGTSLALVVSRLDFKMATAVSILPLITLVVPDVVVAAAWILLLGKQGIFTGWLAIIGIEVPSLYSWWGMIFVMTLNTYVYAFVIMLGAFKLMDRTLEEAGQGLGRPLRRVIMGITLPLMIPSLLSATLIVFTHVIGSFGIPAILGTRQQVLAVKAYNEFVSEMGGNPQMQTTMATILIALGLLVLIAQKIWVEKKQVQMESGHSPLKLKLTGWQRFLADGFITTVIVLSMLPAVVVLITAFTPSVGPVLHYGSFTINNIKYALLRAPEPLYNSLFLASMATVAGVVFSIICAYLIVKRKCWLTSALDVIVMLPLTIAGTVLGIALINTFNTGPIILTGTWIIMSLAYFLRRTPLSTRAAIGPLHNLKDSVEEASISLGIPSIRTFFKVVLPVMLPSITSAAVLMWVTSLSELSATIVLYYGGMSTMPIEIFQQVDSGRLSIASAYSVLLLLCIFVPLIIASKVFKVKLA
ncbi:MAG: iron ABC transporter permease [Burkholderiales bacterium]|nr:iron ABC transporter permease [Burkholderiales bacterium]